MDMGPNWLPTTPEEEEPPNNSTKQLEQKTPDNSVKMYVSLSMTKIVLFNMNRINNT